MAHPDESSQGGSHADATAIEVFEVLAEWPVGAVAATVSDRNGLLGSYGPVDRPFALASVTKLLVAVAVLVAVEEGTLDLSQPAGPPGSTIRHLLAHASGLSPDDDRVVAPPGTRRIYSNRGFEVLGETLAEASGLPASVYLHERSPSRWNWPAPPWRGHPRTGHTRPRVIWLVWLASCCNRHCSLRPRSPRPPRRCSPSWPVCCPGSDGRTRTRGGWVSR